MFWEDWDATAVRLVEKCRPVARPMQRAIDVCFDTGVDGSARILCRVFTSARLC